MVANPSRTMCAVAIMALALPLLLSLRADAGSTPVPRPIHIRGGVQAIAMDGFRLAYEGSVVGAHGTGCDSIFVLDLASGTSTRISRCLPIGSITLAVAGERVAWLDSFCSNEECDYDLCVASLPHPRPRHLASAMQQGDASNGDLVGPWIGNLVGSGDLLAVNRQTTDAKGVATRAELDVIGSKGLRPIVSGPNVLNAMAADSGRIAVLRDEGTVGVYSAAGKLLSQVKPSSVLPENFDGNAVALQGGHLLVLTATRRLEVYDARSGARVHSWPVRKGATNLAERAGAAVYAECGAFPAGGCATYKVHAVGLTTGKDVVIGTGKTFLPTRNLVVSRAGLVYVNAPVPRLNQGPRTLMFVPLSRVLTAVS
jgi:hypothetical protein